MLPNSVEVDEAIRKWEKIEAHFLKVYAGLRLLKRKDLRIKQLKRAQRLLLPYQRIVAMYWDAKMGMR